jgi:indole-3-glycerol phosphate synthase
VEDVVVNVLGSMTALVEVHTGAEFQRAAAASADVIGINARDLANLEVDRSVFADLAPPVPEGTVRVAESGVAEPADVADYYRSGAEVVRVGEALVRSGDPRASVGNFIRAAASH